MARLSAPAIKSPKAERTSSRFREIFKHRPSSSASSSPVTLSKSIPPAESSPMLSPTMPPGFQQVGLLPSERSSHSMSRLLEDEEGRDMDSETIVAEARRQSVDNESATHNASDDLNIIGATLSNLELTLPKLKAENRVKKKGSYVQSMRRVLPQRPAQNTNQDIAATRLAKSEGILPTTAGGADKRRSLPLDCSHRIAEAMYCEYLSQKRQVRHAKFQSDKNNSSYTEGGIDGFDSFVEQDRKTTRSTYLWLN
jgi:hypothetical protein